jgi:hypothetical protein
MLPILSTWMTNPGSFFPQFNGCHALWTLSPTLVHIMLTLLIPWITFFFPAKGTLPTLVDWAINNSSHGCFPLAFTRLSLT